MYSSNKIEKIQRSNKVQMTEQDQRLTRKVSKKELKAGRKEGRKAKQFFSE